MAAIARTGISGRECCAALELANSHLIYCCPCSTSRLVRHAYGLDVRDDLGPEDCAKRVHKICGDSFNVPQGTPYTEHAIASNQTPMLSKKEIDIIVLQSCLLLSCAIGTSCFIGAVNLSEANRLTLASPPLNPVLYYPLVIYSTYCTTSSIAAPATIITLRSINPPRMPHME